MYKTGTPLAEKKILELFLSACGGLKSLHNCTSGSIAHRDFKVSKCTLSCTSQCVINLDDQLMSSVTLVFAIRSYKSENKAGGNLKVYRNNY